MSLANDLLVSILAAPEEGPKILRSLAEKKSTIPVEIGASGPTIVKQFLLCAKAANLSNSYG
jgi:hypothetical protein